VVVGCCVVVLWFFGWIDVFDDLGVGFNADIGLDFGVVVVFTHGSDDGKDIAQDAHAVEKEVVQGCIMGYIGGQSTTSRLVRYMSGGHNYSSVL